MSNPADAILGSFGLPRSAEESAAQAKAECAAAKAKVAACAAGTSGYGPRYISSANETDRDLGGRSRRRRAHRARRSRKAMKAGKRSRRAARRASRR